MKLSQALLIDSNILIYAINADSPKNKLAQKFLRENLGNLFVVHQNVLETIRVLTHQRFSKPMKLNMALRAILPILKSCRIISPDQSTYHLTLKFIEDYKLTGNRIFDAYLAATAIANEINLIATDNALDFQKFSQLSVINPFISLNGKN